MKQPVKHSVKRRNLDDSGGRGAGVSAVFVKDTLRCWLRSWKRFVSIAVITLLGVAVLTGIYAGCRDAFLAAGRFYDQQGLHDLQVLSTYGLTDDDATALRRIDGVQTVQPERSQTVTTLVDGTKKTVTMQEIGTEGLDQPYIRQGKLPNKAGEVAVAQQFLNDSGLKIGGTITVTPQDTSSSVISWRSGISKNSFHFTTDIFKSKRRYRNEKFSKNMRPCFCESGSALYLRI